MPPEHSKHTHIPIQSMQTHTHTPVSISSSLFCSPSLPLSSPKEERSLYGDPGDGDDDVHALLAGTLPLVAVCAVLLVVPVRADSAVHAAAAVLVWLGGRADVLDDGAVDDVLEGGLRVLWGGGGCFLDDGFEDALLRRGVSG